MKVTIHVTPREYFAFNFINKNNGKAIPSPLPTPVLSLIKKGLIKRGVDISYESKTRCWLTLLGKKCINI